MKSHLGEKASNRSIEDEPMDCCGDSSSQMFERFKSEYSGQLTRSSDDERTNEPGDHHIDINSLTDCSASLLNSIE